MNRLHWANDGSSMLQTNRDKISLVKTFDQTEVDRVDGDSRNNAYVTINVQKESCVTVLFGSLVQIERLRAFMSHEGALQWEFSTDTTDGYSDGTWNPIPEITDAGGAKERDWTITPIINVKAVRFYSLSGSVTGSFYQLHVFGDYEEPSFELTDDIGVPLDGDYPIAFSTPASVGVNYVSTAEFYITNTDAGDHSYRVEIDGVGDSTAMIQKSGAFRISYRGGLEDEESIEIIDLPTVTTSLMITIHANVAADDLGPAGLKNFGITITETA